MSMIDPGMESMLEMFIYESTTLLEELDGIMLESEKSKELNEKSINEIFRIMHTIKGSSAMMGLECISNLSHSVEDVFFILRESPDKLKSVSETIYDLLFQASDFIKAEIDQIQAGIEYTPNDPAELIRQLEAQADIMQGRAAPADAPVVIHPAAPPPESAAPAAQEPAAEALVSEADDEGEQRIRVFFDEGCQMENIRAFMLITQLKDWCDQIDSIPPHPEADSSLSNEIIKSGFIVCFKPASAADDLLKVIESSVNIRSYELLGSSAPVVSAASASAPADGTKPSVAADESDESASRAVSEAAAQTGNPLATKVTNKQSLISVNQTKLDQLMDLVGELVTAESMVASNPDLRGLRLDNFNKSTRELRKLTDELQDIVMSIRMVPLSGVFQKMNRIVRDMGKRLDKSVDLVTQGGDTEVDKTINDCLTDPFMHMIRNSMDHAIESLEERRALGKPDTGTLTMSAQNVGGEIVITIADDGRGLDTDKILRKAANNGLLIKSESEYTEKEIFNMIMLPGFSTNEAVTEYSGRGVGMDVVRKNIEKVSGSISVESVKGAGTTFTIKIPLTLAIVDGMELLVGNTVFTLPITSIKQSFKISDPKQVIVNTDGTEMIMLRGDCYPIIRLHNVFGLDTQVTDLCEGIIIQIESGHQVACIFADELIGEQQVVVKPFPVFLNRYNVKGKGLSGCTILGDGSISLILDANNLLTV